MGRPKFQTFLSHNSADKPAVEELARQLMQEGIGVWLDKWNLIPGNPWQEEIEAALDESATCCVFVGPSGIGPWQNAEMRSAIDRRVSKGDFRVIPVLLPGSHRGERSKLPTFLTQTTWVEFRVSLNEEASFHLLKSGIRGVSPGLGPGKAISDGVCPYRGLEVFDVQHAPLFFGREPSVGWLLNELRPRHPSQTQNRFLAIIGASGSGKSSLARAGLVSALKRGGVEGSAEWPVVILKPGRDPLESLAVALADQPSEVVGLRQQLTDDASHLHIRTRFRLRDVPERQRLVLLVDQLEEIFTLCDKDAVRRAFIDTLLYAANEPLGQTVVLLTLRADFYARCTAYPNLAAALSDHQFLVSPMTEEELRDAIVEPALLAGGEVEPGLVELLVEDIKGNAGALPLLEYALMQLWDHRDGRRLTVDGYRAIGRLEGALEQRANLLYEALDPEEQTVCQQIFLRLIQPGEGTEDTRRRAARGELGEAAAVDAVLQELAHARLITVGGRGQDQTRFVEVSHEALIHGWSKLRGWIDDNREELRIQHRFSEAAREWQEHGRDPSYLYRGTRLSNAQEWAQTHRGVPGEGEGEFLEESTRAQLEDIEKEKENRRNGAIAKLAALGAQFSWKEAGKVEGVDLSSSSEDAVPALAALSDSLKKLTLRGATQRDSIVDSLAEFPRLRTLSLSGPGIEDSQLGRLRSLADLVSLDLSGCPGVTDDTARSIGGLKRLRTLDLRGTGISDKALAFLRGLDQLNWLDIGETRITDRGLRGIALKTPSQRRAAGHRLEALRYLGLKDTALGDVGLGHLRQRNTLSKLDVRGTRVTSAGIAAFRGSLADPKKCQVYWDGSAEARSPQLDGSVGAAVRPGVGIRGTDRRVRVEDTTRYPYPLVCSLTSEGPGGKTISTGFLVGRRTVLTAAYSVFSREWFAGWARRVMVYPGRNGESLPFGTHECKRFHAPGPWIATEDLHHCYAVIELPSDVGADLGTVRLAAVSDAELAALRVTVPGYPGDRGLGNQLWQSTGPVLSVSETGFVHDADTFGGMGGAPVLVVEAEGRDGESQIARCVGIHWGSPEADDRAVRVTPAMLSFVLEHMT